MLRVYVPQGGGTNTVHNDVAVRDLILLVNHRLFFPENINGVDF